MKSRWFAWLVGFVVAGIIVGVGAWCVGLGKNRRGLKAAAEVAPVSMRPSLQIDTNTVMLDVLTSVSDTVQRLNVPLATPLTPDKVLSFETRPVLIGRPSSLRSEMIYEGGYEFRHQDSIVFGYRAPDSVRKSDVVKIPSVRPGYDHDTFWTNVLLARLTFKAALRRLGHTNLTLFDKDPSVLDRWADWMDSDPPRWFLS